MEKLTSSCILDAGVDWLTMTAKPDASHLDDVIDVWKFLLNSAENEGHTRNVQNLNGYLGQRCGQFFYGGRETDWMFQATGASGTTAVELLKEVEFHGNISRLDVQTTIDGQTAKAASYEQLRKHRRKLWSERKTRSCRKMVSFESPEGADSVLFGSNSSSSRLIVYNAAAKHPDRYGDAAKRYEARFDGRTSPQPFARLKAAKSISSCAKQIVVGKCQNIGLKERWHKDIPPIQCMSGTVETDEERYFRWLLTQVRLKAVQMALSGKAERVAFALGCEEFKVRPEIIAELGQRGKLKKLSRDGLR